MMAPARAQDSHRARRGGRAGPQGAQPLGLPRAVPLLGGAACLARDRDELLAFYDFPAAHWTHLRTTNVIESAFATIRHRSSRAKGCVTRKTMLSMVYKMGRCAEKSWRRLRGFRHLAKVIEGVRFNDGIEVIEDRRAAA